MGIILKILASLFVGLFSYQLGWLSWGGSLITSIMAFIILYKLGWLWSLPPLSFLTLGSILSIYSGKRERRDYKQVLANGLPALICAITSFEGGYLTALAVSFSDTVATEIGIKFGRKTFLITNFKEVPKGTSGGISLEGTLAGILTITVLSVFGWLMGLNPIPIFLSAVLGFFSDSLIGATLESRGYFGNNTTNFLAGIFGLIVYIFLHP